jgi:hypothetical protein
MINGNKENSTEAAKADQRRIVRRAMAVLDDINNDSKTRGRGVSITRNEARATPFQMQIETTSCQPVPGSSRSRCFTIGLFRGRVAQ